MNTPPDGSSRGDPKRDPKTRKAKNPEQEKDKKAEPVDHSIDPYAFIQFDRQNIMGDSSFDERDP